MPPAPGRPPPPPLAHAPPLLASTPAHAPRRHCLAPCLSDGQPGAGCRRRSAGCGPRPTKGSRARGVRRSLVTLSSPPSPGQSAAGVTHTHARSCTGCSCCSAKWALPSPAAGSPQAATLPQLSARMPPAPPPPQHHIATTPTEHQRQASQPAPASPHHSQPAGQPAKAGPPALTSWRTGWCPAWRPAPPASAWLPRGVPARGAPPPWTPPACA